MRCQTTSLRTNDTLKLLTLFLKKNAADCSSTRYYDDPTDQTANDCIRVLFPFVMSPVLQQTTAASKAFSGLLWHNAKLDFSSNIIKAILRTSLNFESFFVLRVHAYAYIYVVCPLNMG